MCLTSPSSNHIARSRFNPPLFERRTTPQGERRLYNVTRPYSRGCSRKMMIEINPETTPFPRVPLSVASGRFRRSCCPALSVRRHGAMGPMPRHYPWDAGGSGGVQVSLEAVDVGSRENAHDRSTTLNSQISKSERARGLLLETDGTTDRRTRECRGRVVGHRIHVNGAVSIAGQPRPELT